MKDAERYLWDPSAPVVGDVAAIESAFRPLREIPPPLDVGGALAVRATSRRVRQATLAALLMLVVTGGLGVLRARAPWEVRTVAGVPSVDGASESPDRLAAGMVVETDGISRARFVIGRIGSADLLPGSRVRVLRADADEQRFALERGTFVGSVSSSGALGSFVLQTPFARAARASGDECAFDVGIDAGGTGRVTVREGVLEVEGGRHATIVPAGNAANLGGDRGPGIPYPIDATGPFRTLVEEIDSLGPSGELVTALLPMTDRRSTITLFHLLPRLAPDDRLPVVDRLASLVPPPPDVTRDGLARLDSVMLARWLPALHESWNVPRLPAWRRAWRRLRIPLEWYANSPSR